MLGLEMVVKVRQRQYAIGLSNTKQNELVTHNIWTCTGFAGVSKEGVSFLAHFDFWMGTKVLTRLLGELEKHGVKDFSDFKLVIATGWAGKLQGSITRRILRARLKKLGASGSIPETTFFTNSGLNEKGGIRVNTAECSIEFYKYDNFIKRERYKPKPWYRFSPVRTMLVEDETPEELNAPKRA